jgi:hypothetical protein
MQVETAPAFCPGMTTFFALACSRSFVSHPLMKSLFWSAIALTACLGCASGGGFHAESGPGGTIAYMVKIESSEPGARVEVNDDFVGRTPVDVKIFGDRDGTFHNFGSSDFVIRVFPVKEGQHMQSKVFRTGGWFAQEDRIPTRLFFDLNQTGSGTGFTVDPGKPRY